MGGWLHTEMNVLHRELNPVTVTHLGTNRIRRRLTSLIETNVLPLRQTTTCWFPLGDDGGHEGGIYADAVHEILKLMADGSSFLYEFGTNRKLICDFY